MLISLHKRFFQLPAAVIIGVGLLLFTVVMLSLRISEPLSAQGPTIITNDITTNTTWTLANSPYHILTSTVAVDGAVLTIEPGVIVRIQDGGHIQVNNSGQLIAQGTDAQPIVFTSLNPNPIRGIWDGIQINATSVSTIEHSILEYGREALRIDASNTAFYILSNTIRYAGDFDGNANTGAAIKGTQDDSFISFNTVYSSEIGIRLDEIEGNLIQGNHIYDIDENCLAIIPGGASSTDNQIINNQLFNCGSNGISINDGGTGTRNLVSGNIISNTLTDALFLRNQRLVTVTDNVIYDITDNNVSGITFDTFHFESEVHGNAICVDDRYEIENNTAVPLSAQGNWLGTNTPQVGTEINGNVAFTPHISITANFDASALPADGTSSSVLTITMNDGAGRTVPTAARAVDLASSLGTISPSLVMLDNSGTATATFIAPTTQGTTVISASPFCGNFVYTTTLEIQAADLTISKSPAITQVLPGDLITYTITYTNNGNIPADGVIITDALPTGTTWASDDAVGQGFTRTPILPSTMVTYELGTVPSMGSGAITLVAQVGDQSAVGCTAGGQPLSNRVGITSSTLDDNVADNAFIDTNGVSIVCADLAITKTGPGGTVSPGETITYTIAYTNIGQALAQNVVITDVSPITGGIVTLVDGISLPPGSASSVNYAILTDASICQQAGSYLTNTAYIATSTPETDLTNNVGTSDSTTAPLIACQDLAITKTVSSIGTHASVPTTYTIQFANTGSFTATGVVITDFLHPEVNYVTDTLGIMPSVMADLVSWNIGDLAPNQSTSFEFAVAPSLSANCIGGTLTITNAAQISSNPPDITPADNYTLTAPIDVGCTPTISLAKNDGGLICAVPGQLIDYSIQVSNNLSTPLSNLLLTDFIPANTSFQGPVDGTWTMAGSGSYTHNIAVLNGNASIQIPIWAQVDPGISNTVTVITNTVSLAPDGLTTVVTTPISFSSPDLWVVKNDNIELLPDRTADMIRRIESKMGEVPWLASFKQTARIPDATYVSPGDVVSYTIGYGNAGNTAATNVVITETLPANTTFLGPAYWQHTGGNTYVFTISNLAAGQGDLLDFRVRVDDPFPANVIGITNTVEIDSDFLLECDPSDNINIEFTRVQEPVSSDEIYLPIILIIDDPILVNPPTPTPSTPIPPTPTPTPQPLAWVRDVAADPTTNQIFVTGPREDAVHVIDGGPDTYMQAVPVGHGPSGLAVLTSTTPSKIAVAHSHARNDWAPGVWYIASDNLQPHAMTDDNGYVGAAPVKVTANSLTNRFYLSNYYDRMPLLDAVSETRLSWVHKKNFQASFGLEVSQRTNLIHMAAIDTGELIIFDAAQAESNPFSDPVNLGYGACHNPPPDSNGDGVADPRIMRMIAVNPTTGHVFVTSPPDPNPDINQTDSLVYVLDEDALIAEAAANGGPPSDMTCRWNFPKQTQRVPDALPGKAWIRTLTLPNAIAAGTEGITVNPVTGRVYVTDSLGDQVFVLQDDPTGANIDYVTTIPVGDNPIGVDVNLITNKVYVANAHDVYAAYGTVTVIDGATNAVIETISLTAVP